MMSDALQSTLNDGKQIAKLARRYAKLEVTEKLSSVTSTLVLIAIITAVGMIALFCIGMFFVTELGNLTGNMAWGYAIVGLFFLLLCLIILLVRKALIDSPIRRSMISKFFKDEPMSDDINIEKLKTQYEILLVKERVQANTTSLMGGGMSSGSRATGFMQYIAYGISAFRAYQSIRTIVHGFKKKRR